MRHDMSVGETNNPGARPQSDPVTRLGTGQADARRVTLRLSEQATPFPSGEVLMTLPGSNAAFPGIPRHSADSHPLDDTNSARFRRSVVAWIGVLLEAAELGCHHFEWRGDVLEVWDDHPYSDYPYPQLIGPDADGYYPLDLHWMQLSDEQAGQLRLHYADALAILAGGERPSAAAAMLDYLTSPTQVAVNRDDLRAALVGVIEAFDDGTDRGPEYERITAARARADHAVTEHVRACIGAAARAILRFHPDAWAVRVDLSDRKEDDEKPVELVGLDGATDTVPFSVDPRWPRVAADVVRWLTDALTYRPVDLAWCLDFRNAGRHVVTIGLLTAQARYRHANKPDEVVAEPWVDDPWADVPMPEDPGLHVLIDDEVPLSDGEVACRSDASEDADTTPLANH